MAKRIAIALSDADFEKLWRLLTSKYPMSRENPRKAWTEAEKTAAVRASMAMLVQDMIKDG